MNFLAIKKEYVIINESDYICAWKEWFSWQIMIY